MLDAGALPVEDVATLTDREGRRPRAIYQAHRWFARRPGTEFRALLTAAALPVSGDFWDSYYGSVDYAGQCVLDPFVGGGTAAIEALRLGASVVGFDVDGVACAVTRFETEASRMPDLHDAVASLRSDVGKKMAPLYRTLAVDGEASEVLHYFWVQVVTCESCGSVVEAHPHYRLAYEAEGSKQWVFCRECHAVKELGMDEREFTCPVCETHNVIEDGPVVHGWFTCPNCGKGARLIDVARTAGRPPEWRCFALEALEIPSGGRTVPMSKRRFCPATKYDDAVFRQAVVGLVKRRRGDGGIAWIPQDAIPSEGRSDNRILSYGYRHYFQLFNPRQLLHLSYLAEAIAALKDPIRTAIVLAFSNHLATNCMMTQYAFGWRRLTPLFSLRAYRHVSRPVEINPWLESTGRGTFPNAVRQVQRAIDFARKPKEPHKDGGFRMTKPIPAPVLHPLTPSVRIVHGSSEQLDLVADGSVDLVLTDPPYFDNIAYSELSDFYLPWLRMLGVVPENGAVVARRDSLAARGRGAKDAQHFQHGLALCFREMARALKPEGRLIFTYQHSTPVGWMSLATAFLSSGLIPVQLIPMLGSGDSGLHHHSGSIRWDAVFVAARNTGRQGVSALELTEESVRSARNRWAHWAKRLEQSHVAFTEADQLSFYRACLVYEALMPTSEDQIRVTTALTNLLDGTTLPKVSLEGGVSCAAPNERSLVALHPH
jgi:adenine-specific DNA methylase